MPITPNGVMERPYEAAASGRPGWSGGRRVGYIGTSATTTVAVRGTTYTPQGTNAARVIKSSSANDAAAGTGARKVVIEYLKADGSGPFTTEVTLNGTNEVSTNSASASPQVSDIALIERMYVSEVGSGGGNAGTISLLTAAAGSTWASIAAGDNQTYWAHHYVPLGKTCFVTELDVCGKNVNGIATLNSADPTNTAKPQKNLDTSHGYINQTNPITLIPPIPVVGPALIWINSKPDSNTASTTHAALGYYELDT